MLLFSFSIYSQNPDSLTHINDTILPTFNCLNYKTDINGFRKYIANNLKYPDQAFKNEEQGVVIVQFVIDPNGDIDSIRLRQSCSTPLNQEAIRIIKNSDGCWTPMEINGIKTNTTYTESVFFIIDSDPYSVDIKSYLEAQCNFALKNKDYNSCLHILNKLSLIDQTNVKYIKLRNAILNHDNLSNIKKISDVEIGKNEEVKVQYFIDSLVYTRADEIKKDIILYYDKTWRLSDSINYAFYRVTNWSRYFNYFEGEFKDFTADNILLAKGFYKNTFKTGVYKKYYENGVVNIEGNFIYNKPTGKWNIYYQNSNIEQSVLFENDGFKILSYYDSAGNNLISKPIVNWTYSLGNNNIYVNGIIKDGKKEGFWTVTAGNDKTIIGEDFYHFGKYKYTILFDEEGKSQKQKTPLIGEWIFTLPLDYFEQLEFNSNISNADYNFIKQ